ncbi:MAG: hypothetical protein V3U19_03695 [Thermodesulfobacteriota bacterium]
MLSINSAKSIEQLFQIIDDRTKGISLLLDTQMDMINEFRKEIDDIIKRTNEEGTKGGEG